MAKTVVRPSSESHVVHWFTKSSAKSKHKKKDFWLIFILIKWCLLLRKEAIMAKEIKSTQVLRLKNDWEVKAKQR